MSLLREMWSVLSRRQRRAILIMQLVSLLVACSTTVGVAAIAPFFAVLGNPRLIGQQAWLQRLYLAGGFSNARGFLSALALGFVGVVLLANLVSLVGFIAMHRLARRIGNELQSTLFDAYLRRPYAFHAHTSSVTLLNNVIYETTRFTHGILENAFTFVTSLVTALLILASLAVVKAAVAALLLALLAGGYLLIYLGVRHRLLQFGAAQTQLANRQAQIVGDSLGAIKEVTVLHAQGFFGAEFERISRDFLRAATYSQLVAQSPRHLMECAAAATLAGVALFLGLRPGGLGQSLGSLTFLALAAYRLLPALQQMFAALVRIRADRPALTSIAADLIGVRRGEREHNDAAPEYARAGLWRERPCREIRLRDLSFRYAAERPWVLRGLSLHIPAGATVGIVGTNGAGKSTLMDLIAGLLRPITGRVEVDGCLLNDANREAWQRCIAYVPQNAFLLNSSIAANIALGVPAGAIDRQRLEEAARRAQLSELLDTLPGGYQQPVGERGIALSGGQRQRLGIARALYRSASVLLLDEATNSLDGLSEQELLATLAALRGRCTIVLIAHRLSTVRRCDVIFELAQGRVSASGSYDELLRASGGFRELAGRL